MAINSLSASSYGLSGLVSGINSQDMVEKLLSGTQSKIDKKSQQKTVLQMKQQLYRDVATQMKKLQSSYLSFTSGTNLLSSSFYDTMTATVTPPNGVSAAFGVTGSSSANVGNAVMKQINQLATARSYKTNTDASGAVIVNMDKASAENLLDSYRGSDAQLNIVVGNDEKGYKTISFSNAPERFGGKSQTEVVNIINDELRLNGVGAEARFVNNKLQIIADDPEDYITVRSNNNATDTTLAMRMFGLSSAALSGKGTFSASIDTDNYLPSFDVNLDGRQQTIRMDLNALKTYVQSGDETALMTDINQKLQNVFGAGVKLQTNSDGKWEFSAGNPSQKFTISGLSEVMGTIGIKSGMSNKLNSNLSLRELNFATELQGNQQTFSINGVEFSFTSSSTLGDIINEINASKAGVKISYLESEDRFVIQNNETGAGTREITIDQSEGNFLSALFGAEGSNSVLGYGVNVDLQGGEVDGGDYMFGGTFTFNMNGRDYKFTVPKKANGGVYSANQFAKAMNDAFASMFGTKSDGTQNIEFLAEDDKFTIRTNDKHYNITAKAEGTGNDSTLGFTPGASTLATDGNTTLAEAGIKFGDAANITIKVGGNEIVINNATLPPGKNLEDLSMKELAELMSDGLKSMVSDPSDPPGTKYPTVTYDEKTAAFRVMGVDIPMEIVVNGDADSENLDNLFGQDSIKTGAEYVPGFDMQDLQKDAGQNAQFILNDQLMERASNTFTIEGLTYTLYNTTHKDQVNKTGDHEAPTTITVTRDTDKIVDGIVEFLKLYNETVDFITGLVKSDATYKDYAPLTQEQKNGMSDREVELWEEKSKEGLLRNDSYLEKILSTMRGIMYSKPEGSSIAIYDLGITTSYYTSDGNLNPESVDSLRAAIEADPEAVRNLFAGDGGLMDQLNEAINDATRSSYSNPGYLTQVAGANGLDTSSTIYNEIKDLDDQLLSLESRYWNEYNRYWKQFNSMEQMIQQMNTQSSWLSQQLG